MLTASAEYKASLVQSHASYVRVLAYSRDVDNVHSLLCTLPTSSGTLTIDSNGDYWRTADMEVSDEIVDSTGVRVSDLINAADTDVTIEFGVDIGGGTVEYVKVATLRIDRIERAAFGSTLTITATDDGSRLGRYPILVPWPNDVDTDTATGRRMIDTIKKFVNDTYPGDPPTWNVSDEADSRNTWVYPEGLKFQGSRWQSIHDLCDALGVWVFNTPDVATWGMAKLPGLVTPSVWTYHSGDYQMLVDTVVDDDRDEVFNVVYVRYEMPDKGSAVAMAADDDPSSFTYYLGPYGRQVKELDNDIVENATDAEQVATELLAQYVGRGERFEVTSVYNPLMIPGDHVEVETPDGEYIQHIVNRIVLPWPAGRMTLQTRVTGTVPDPGS